MPTEVSGSSIHWFCVFGVSSRLFLCWFAAVSYFSVKILLNVCVCMFTYIQKCYCRFSNCIKSLFTINYACLVFR